jgi:hypothetical protein
MRNKSSSSGTVKSSKRVAFSYHGRDVLCDGEGLVSLTDMWEAAGSPCNLEPTVWGQKGGADFIGFITENLGLPKRRVFKVSRESGGREVWSHRQVALAYAKQLSNEFHAFVNEGFIEWADESRDPALKAVRAIEAYRRQGREENWIEGRLRGMAQRRTLAATMKRHECQASGEVNPFAEGTRVITRELFGQEPHELRASRGLPRSASTRDCLDRLELARLHFAESEAENLINVRDAVGNEECIEACRDAGQAVRLAINSMY